MRNNSFRKRNLNKIELFNNIFEEKYNNRERLYSKLITLMKGYNNKANDIKIKNKRKYNIINYNHRSRSLNNNKDIIKHNLESNINLTQDYKNFCKSFLYPYYDSEHDLKILNDLKAIGPRRTINKHFSQEKKSTKCLKNKITYSNKKNKNSLIKSKYLNFINSTRFNHNNLINYNNNNKNIFNSLYNNILSNKNKRIFKQKDNIKKNFSINNDNNFVINKGAYKNSLKLNNFFEVKIL